MRRVRASLATSGVFLIVFFATHLSDPFLGKHSVEDFSLDLFSLIIPDFSGGDFEVETGVVDLDRSELSAVFTDEVLASVESGGLIPFQPNQTEIRIAV